MDEIGLKIKQSSGYALFTPVVWSRGGKSNKHERENKC
jgi:hypothetical protein